MASLLRTLRDGSPQRGGGEAGQPDPRLRLRQCQLAERRHPTRDELDQVSTRRADAARSPVGASRRRQLEGAGGRRRHRGHGRPGGWRVPPQGGQQEPDGVLEETAFRAALKLLGRVGADGVRRSWARARSCRHFGYTTAAGGAPRRAAAAMRQVAARRAADRRRRVSRRSRRRDFIKANGAPRATPTGWHRRRQDRHRRLATGLHCLARSPVLQAGRQLPPATRAADRDDRAVIEPCRLGLRNDVQILTHANGEAAIDRSSPRCRRATEARPGQGPRPVLIHGQFLREDQVDASRLNVFLAVSDAHLLLGRLAPQRRPWARCSARTSRRPAGPAQARDDLHVAPRRAGGVPDRCGSWTRR